MMMQFQPNELRQILEIQLKENPGLRKFVRNVKPTERWHMTFPTTLSFDGATLALEVLDELEAAEFAAKQEKP